MQVALYKRIVLIDNKHEMIVGLFCEDNKAIYDYNYADGFKVFGKVESKQYAEYVKDKLIKIINNNKTLFEQANYSYDEQVQRIAYCKLWSLFRDYPIKMR